MGDPSRAGRYATEQERGYISLTPGFARSCACTVRSGPGGLTFPSSAGGNKGEKPQEGSSSRLGGGGVFGFNSREGSVCRGLLRAGPHSRESVYVES